MSFSAPAVIFSQMLTSSSLNPQAPSYRSSLVNYFPSWVYSVISYYYNCLELMVWLDSHYLGLELQDLIVVVSRLYLPSSLSNNFTVALMAYRFCLLLKSKDIPPHLHVALCCYIGRNTWYQAPPLFTCWMNSWRIFYSTRSYLLLWLTKNRLPLVSESWCNIPIKFSLYSLNLFQNFTVDGCDVDWTQ